MGSPQVKYPPSLSSRARRVLQEYHAEKNVKDDPLAVSLVNATLQAVHDNTPARSATEYAALVGFTAGWAIRSKYRLTRLLTTWR